MGKLKRKSIFFVLSAVMLFSFVFTNAGLGESRQALAETADSLSEQIVTYQGENNWYYYSGDFSEKDLRYMLYSPYNTLWQGQEEFSRVYSLSLVQMPSENYDTIRAKVISKNGKIRLTGRAEYYADSITGTEVTIGVMLARNGDLEQLTTLVAYTVLDSSEDSFLFEDSVDEISVSSGDVVFFVTQASGSKSAAVIFDIKINYEEIESSSAPSNHVLAKNLVAGEGNLNFSYESNTNSLRDESGIVQNAMQVTNEDEYLQYVYQPSGLEKVYSMDFAGYDSPGWWFTMPQSLNSVGAVWQSKFYSNPNSGFGWSGLCYTAPVTGKVSVIGVTARSSAVEIGDDSASFGESEEYARWDLIVISGDRFQTVASDAIVPDQIRTIETVGGTQNIEVNAGDSVFLRYVCSAPWKTSCIFAGFNFTADPIDSFEGWSFSADVTGESFSSVQGENATYYAYGKTGEKYWLFDNVDEEYRGGNVYAEVGVSAAKTDISSAFETIRIYKAIGNGNATLRGNFIQTTFDSGNVTLSIYKRAYNGTSWGKPELLNLQTINQRKFFAEFSVSDTLNNGDLLFVTLIKDGELTDSKTLQGVLNVDFSFSVSSEAEEIEGVGATASTMREDQFATEQGKTGWFYAYGNPDNYVLMSYGFGKVTYDNWSGPEWNNRIEVGKLCPSPYSGSILIYVAPADGTFKAEGVMGVESTDSYTGVSISVLKNGETVLERTIDYGDFQTDPFDIQIEVKKGDTIMFYVKNVEGNTVAYFTAVSLNFTYEFDAEGSSSLTPNELLSYLSPKASYAEYVGIENNYTKKEDNVLEADSSDGSTSGCSGAIGTSGVFFWGIGLAYLGLKRRRK